MISCQKMAEQVDGKNDSILMLNFLPDDPMKENKSLEFGCRSHMNSSLPEYVLVH